MFRIRTRNSGIRRCLWMIKNIWYYVIFIYLMFTCFYLINMTFPWNTKLQKTKRKPVKKRVDPTLPPLAPKEEFENENDFMNMFPDPKLHPNPREIRRQNQQIRELQNSQLDKKRRLQLENEQRMLEKIREIKLQNRIQLSEDLVPYKFSSSKTKHRVDVISKIRWRYLQQGSVEITGFNDVNLPGDMSEHFYKLRDIMNTAQTLEFSYKPFTLVRPSFAVDSDRKIFLKNLENENAMRKRPGDQFRGVIDVYKDGLVSEQLDCGYKHNRRAYIEFTTDNKNVKTLNKAVCPLLVPNGNTFQTFIHTVLPKIIQAYDLITTSNIYLLINEPSEPNILMLYDRLGIDRNRLIFHNHGIWRVKTVVDVCITPPLHPTLYKIARRAFGSQDNLTVPLREAKVVLLLRDDTANGDRNILNRAEVIGVLFNRYSSNLKLVTKPLTVSETVDIFRNAKIIIGVHGGAFYNIIFAPSGTSIIEIIPTEKSGQPCQSAGKLDHTMFWSLSAMLGQNYWRIIENPKQDLCNIKVDVGKLDRVLKRIDDRHIKQDL